MLEKLSYVLTRPAVWRALICWPKFSLTSFRMVASLVQQGVLPRTVIDVGANAGQFAVASAMMFAGATVYSFEPTPQCVEQLRKNVGNLRNVRVFPVALGASRGEVSFNVNSHSHSSSILALGASHKNAFPGAQVVATISVPLSTLDHELVSVSLQGPVLLKLDVQGYELEVLAGAHEILGKVDYVVLEASFRPMYEGEKSFMDIVRAMERSGFTFLRPVGWLSDPRTDEILQADLLFAKSEACGA